jgi:acylphosphatase
MEGAVSSGELRIPDTSVIRHVMIRGRVQGVGYRAWTQYNAEGRGLHGWVRNRRDGSVEAVFAGGEGDVRAMINECRVGPPGSRVDAIEEREGTAEELMLRSGYRFAMLPTA